MNVVLLLGAVSVGTVIRLMMRSLILWLAGILAAAWRAFRTAMKLSVVAIVVVAATGEVAAAEIFSTGVGAPLIAEGTAAAVMAASPRSLMLVTSDLASAVE